MSTKLFSDQLEEWLNSKGTKTVSQLGDVFGRHSFAITIVVLMFLPALPIPTGGITHIFEIISMVLALEMAVGMQTIWLPDFAKKIKLGKRTMRTALPFMMRRIRWFEHYSRPRYSNLLEKKATGMIVGFLMFGFSLAAFLAPPFSGLDTLPALGVVALALSLILGDVAVLLIGVSIGIFGIFLELTLGTIIFKAFGLLLKK